MLLLDPAHALRKVGSAGKPPLFVDIRIVRPDGTACEPNETGERLVSGPNVMAGYWDRAAATREVIDEYGWLRTGDAARIDDQGFVWIVDRLTMDTRCRATSCTRAMSSACSHHIPRSLTPPSCHATETARASSVLAAGKAVSQYAAWVLPGAPRSLRGDVIDHIRGSVAAELRRANCFVTSSLR